MIFSPKQIMYMYYNSTGITHFDIPISPSRVHYMRLDDTQTLFDVLIEIKRLKIQYMGELTTTSPKVIEKVCNRIIAHPYLELILAGIILLLLLSLLVIIWKTYSICYSKNGKQEIDSLQYDHIIDKYNNTHGNNEQELYYSINSKSKMSTLSICV